MVRTSESKLARPVVIGLIGGVASGKSVVGEMLAKRGAVRIDADRLGHEVLQEPEVRERLAQHWGSAILNSEGQIERKALGELVFGKDSTAIANRRLLESIVHPRIRSRAEQEIASARASGKLLTAIVIDAPLLLEAGWEPLCDLILYIDAPIETRLARATARGWSQSHFEDREASQWSLSEKRSRATHVLDNSVGADIEGQVERLWSEILRCIDV